MSKIVCVYCETINETGSTECIACGAPLEGSGPVSDAQPEPLPFTIQPLENMKPVNDFEQMQKAFIPASNTLGAASRTLGVALAIGLSIGLTAFGLGVVGAILDMALWALLGAVLVGIAVGMSMKSFWPTILGAPLGALAGMLAGGILWAVGLGPQWIVLTCSVGAILGAVIGSHRRAAGSSWWDKLRPWLGALGALFFGVTGLFIGEAFQQLIRLLQSQ
jgi:hypothetical protein